MFYTILPPILVILSLVGIIVFLVKKYSKIKKALQDDLAETLRKEKAIAENFPEDIAGENKKGNWKKAENVFLIILEKTVRRLKTFFLKMEVYFSNWSAKIRNRRNGGTAVQGENNLEVSKENEILEKINDYKTKNIQRNDYAKKEELKISIPVERIAEPMISKKVALPKAKVGIKNKLEELLIERVAANPKDIEAYERLGEYYMEIENYSDAKECFKQVMKLNPANRNVKYKIRRLERLLGE